MSIEIDYTSGFFEASPYGESVGTTTEGPGAYNLRVASYDGVSFSVAGQESSPSGFFFKPDGTKMYVIGFDGDDVNEYNLSTAWDVSSASYVQNFSIASEEATPQGIFFRSDGLKMYITGNSGDEINEYNLSTAWDISTASFLQLFSVISQENTPTGVFFKPDGLKMYVSGSGSNLHEYNLSTAWDVSSASFIQSFATGVGSAREVFFTPDGSRFFIPESTAPYNVTKFSLSTPWDISTAVSGDVFPITQDTLPQSLFFKDDGTKMYVLGTGTDAIYQYSTGVDTTIDLSSGNYFEFTPSSDVDLKFINPPASGTGYDFTLKITGGNTANAYDLANAVYDNKSFSVSSQDTSLYSIHFKPDGLKLYVGGGQNDSIYQYTLSTAWDITTASYDSVSFSVTSQSLLSTGLFFKPDGTKMYVLDFDNDGVYQYTLSTPWDLSTASYDSVSFTVTGGTDVTNLQFTEDGTKFIVTFRGAGDLVRLYNLSTPWDITTASVGSDASVGSQSNLPVAGWINSDGSRLFVTDYASGTIYQYSLSIPYDLSSLSYDSVSFVSNSTSMLSLFFSPDGTKLYTSNATGTIYQYTTGTLDPAIITFPSNVFWSNGTSPVSPAVRENDVLTFYTINGGNKYYGFKVGDSYS